MMNFRRPIILAAPILACLAFPAFAEERDDDDADDAPQVTAFTKRATSNDCACPKAGMWKAQNLEGWMKCTGPVNISQKLDPVKDRGTIWILDEQCDSIFSEASRKQDEDILMERDPDSCKFTGVVSGQTNGVTMVIDVFWPDAGETFIKGDMHSKPNFQGMTCEYYRPYEITFEDGLTEAEIAERKPKMLKKLKAYRDKQK